METENIEEKLKIVLEHYNAKIITDWSKADMYFYQESTADGYEVYIAEKGPDFGSPDFNQDVYYYESDWLEKLPDCIRDGMTIQIGEYDIVQSEDVFKDAITELYEEISPN